LNVKRNLKRALKQMKLIQEGKLPKKTLKESRELWDKLSK